MHYYKRNLGDYAKKAGRLSMLQHGAYTLLIDACYDRERFPTESEAIEWTWASSPEEEQAVKFVLSRFFELQGDETYVQPRIFEEVQLYKVGEIQNRLIALAREARKQDRTEFANACDQLRGEIKDAPLSKTHEAWTLVVDALIKTHEAPPNQEPLTTNHKPSTNNPPKSPKGESKPKFDPTSGPFPPGLNVAKWIEWCEVRKAKRKPVSKQAAEKQFGSLLQYDGATQAQIIDQSIGNDYTGLFPPKPGAAPKAETGAEFLSSRFDRTWADGMVTPKALPGGTQ